MEYKEIKKYISDMETSKLDELNIEFPDGTKIEMKKNTNKINCSEDIIPQQFIQAIPQQIPQQQINKVVVNTEENIVSASLKQEDNYKKIKSPMVGTFYSKPAPNAEAFVKVGDRVKKGQIVCIVEAMKLMNEIESEFDGEVVEICCNDEDMVEYGKVLIKVK